MWRPGFSIATFDKADAPPPFNWTFATKGGVAEPAGNGRLQVIYYGREDAVLAQQLLLLGPAGTGSPWRSTASPATAAQSPGRSPACRGNEVVFSLPLKHGQRATAGGFAVPQGCQAQRLELTGSIGEFPQSIDFTIAKLQLVKAAAR